MEKEKDCSETFTIDGETFEVPGKDTVKQSSIAVLKTPDGYELVNDETGDVIHKVLTDEVLTTKQIFDLVREHTTVGNGDNGDETPESVPPGT